MNCPKCGRLLTRWEPRPGGRQAGYCACNPAGPVVTAKLPDPLLEIDGIDETIAAALHARGLDTGPAIGAATDADLLAIPGLGPARMARLRNYFEE